MRKAADLRNDDRIVAWLLTKRREATIPQMTREEWLNLLTQLARDADDPRTQLTALATIARAQGWDKSKGDETDPTIAEWVSRVQEGLPLEAVPVHFRPAVAAQLERS